MSFHVTFPWLVLVLLVGTYTLAGSAAAHADVSGNTPVVVVFDATEAAACRSWIGSPAHETRCAPGSVISSYVTTAQVVKQQ